MTDSEIIDAVNGKLLSELVRVKAAIKSAVSRLRSSAIIGTSSDDVQANVEDIADDLESVLQTWIHGIDS